MKILKKTIAFLLSLIIITSVFSQNALAISPVEYFCENALSDRIDYSVPSDNSSFSDSVKNYFYPYDATSGFSRNFKSHILLDANLLKIYNAISNAEIGTMSVTVDYEYGTFPKADLTQDYLKTLMEAIDYDLPQLFYFGGYQIGYVPTGEYITKIIYNILLPEVRVGFADGTISTFGSSYTADTLKTCWNDIQTELKSLNLDVSNRYNFVKSVHDYLCNKIIYPQIGGSLYNADCHNIYGALVTGYAVCQGYGEAFKLICDLYKIPCVCVVGTGNGGAHLWNAVQMEDGLWYLIDVTWDDQTRIYHDFFLSGTETVCSAGFGGTAFNKSHIADVNQIIPTLNYATQKYSETNHDTAFKGTYNSLSKEDDNFLIRSYFDVKDSYVYYNGMYIDTDGLTTNEKFNVPSGDKGVEEAWSLVLLGDCNGDGNCNALDYSDAVNKVLSDNGVSSAYDMAADMDCDGYLDVIDLAIFSIAVNGLDTDIRIES